MLLGFTSEDDENEINYDKSNLFVNPCCELYVFFHFKIILVIYFSVKDKRTNTHSPTQNLTFIILV